MITAFLIGLLVGLATFVVTFILNITALWLVEFVKKKLRTRKNHKVAFADTREVVDDYIKNEVDGAKEISMEDLEKLCEESPYVAAVVDENGDIGEYEGFKTDKINENFSANIRKQHGMIIVDGDI